VRTVGSRQIVALTHGPLRGRAEIIQELSDLLSGVRRDGGGVTVLTGVSGVGLTRLLVEAQGLAASRGVRVAHGFPAGPDVDSNLIDPYRRLHAWRQWLTASARRDPLLITIDDLPRLDLLVLAGLRAFRSTWLSYRSCGSWRRPAPPAADIDALDITRRPAAVAALTAGRSMRSSTILKCPRPFGCAPPVVPGAAPHHCSPFRDGAPPHAARAFRTRCTRRPSGHRVGATAAHWLFTEARSFWSRSRGRGRRRAAARSVSVIEAAADLLGCGVWWRAIPSVRPGNIFRVVASDLSPSVSVI
jgi:hypothetical protein